MAAVRRDLLQGLAAMHVDGHAAALLIGDGRAAPPADCFGPDLGANVASLRRTLRRYRAAFVAGRPVVHVAGGTGCGNCSSPWPRAFDRECRLGRCRRRRSELLPSKGWWAVPGPPSTPGKGARPVISSREAQLLAPEDQRFLELYRSAQYTRLLGEVEEPIKAERATVGMLGLAALACAALGRAGEAQELAGTAVRAQPGWAWLHHAVAAAHAAGGNLPGALAEQRQATRLAPGEPGYLVMLAQYERALGAPAAAARACRQALLQDPEHVSALNELGLALMELGDAAGARQQFRRAQELAPGDPYGYYHEGLLHRTAGAPAAARACFRAALRRSPRFDQAENRLADLLAGGRPWLQRALRQLLFFGRMGLMGWTITAFFYYVGFRLLQILWGFVPGLLPAAQGLLWVSLAYLLGAGAGGRLLRWGLRLGPTTAKPTKSPGPP